MPSGLAMGENLLCLCACAWARSVLVNAFVFLYVWVCVCVCMCDSRLELKQTPAPPCLHGIFVPLWLAQLHVKLLVQRIADTPGHAGARNFWVLSPPSTMGYWALSATHIIDSIQAHTTEMPNQRC